MSKQDKSPDRGTHQEQDLSYLLFLLPLHLPWSGSSSSSSSGERTEVVVHSTGDSDIFYGSIEPLATAPALHVTATQGEVLASYASLLEHRGAGAQRMG